MPIFDTDYKQAVHDLVASTATALMCFCSKIMIIIIAITLNSALFTKPLKVIDVFLLIRRGTEYVCEETTCTCYFRWLGLPRR